MQYNEITHDSYGNFVHDTVTVLVSLVVDYRKGATIYNVAYFEKRRNTDNQSIINIQKIIKWRHFRIKINYFFPPIAISLGFTLFYIHYKHHYNICISFCIICFIYSYMHPMDCLKTKNHTQGYRTCK